MTDPSWSFNCWCYSVSRMAFLSLPPNFAKIGSPHRLMAVFSFFDGQPVFGASKSLRGILASIAITSLVGSSLLFDRAASVLPSRPPRWAAAARRDSQGRSRSRGRLQGLALITPSTAACSI
jgi:hypothetical protein